VLRPLTTVGGVREGLVVTRRGRGKTLCARGACRASVPGPSTSPLGVHATTVRRLLSSLLCSERDLLDSRFPHPALSWRKGLARLAPAPTASLRSRYRSANCYLLYSRRIVGLCARGRSVDRHLHLLRRGIAQGL